MSGRARYAAVLSSPHVAKLAAAGLLARAPVGLNGLAIVLFIREQTGSYGSAGSAAAAYAVGSALVAPLMSRVVDRLGARRVLRPLALLHASALGALIALGLAGAPLLALCAAAALAGCAIPPVGPVMRALWPRLMHERPDLLPAAYALDSVSIELAFIAGPLLLALTVTLASPQLALGLAVLLTIGGSLAFTANEFTRDFSPGGEHAHDTGGRLGALRSAGVRTLVATMVPIGFCLGAAEVAFPAFGEDVGSRALAGPLIAIWSVGSAIGGLVYGSRGHLLPLRRTFLIATAVVPLVTIPLVLPSSFAAMVPLALLAGVAIAPLISISNQLIGLVAPQGALTEAFTWPLTSLVAGVAAGNAVAGHLVQSQDWRAAFATAAAVGTLGALIALIGRRTLGPDEPRALAVQA